MFGKKNGVVAKLKEDNPHIINIHCMNYRLQLAVSKAFNYIPAIENTDELLAGLFIYYHYSTVKSERLKAVQNLLRETGEIDLKANLTVVRGIHTRYTAMRRLFKLLENCMSPLLGTWRMLSVKAGINMLKTLAHPQVLY